MILGVIIFIILLFLLIGYNTLIKEKNKVKRSKHTIDVYLNQRFDLIPNLVECVKGYSKYEKEVFDNIIALRKSFEESKETNFDDAKKLNDKFNQIIAIAESYPDLKASDQYLSLQKSLTKVESQLQAARRIYNNDVTSYNTKIESVPTNIIAMLFHFKQAELFEIEEYKKDNINVNIDN